MREVTRLDIQDQLFGVFGFHRFKQGDLGGFELEFRWLIGIGIEAALLGKGTGYEEVQTVLEEGAEPGIIITPEKQFCIAGIIFDHHFRKVFTRFGHAMLCIRH